MNTLRVAQKLFLVLSLGVLLLLQGCAPADAPKSGSPAADAAAEQAAEDAAPDVITDRLTEVLKSPHRSVENIARDGWRHPKETLEFFGVKDDLVVMEIWPGGGWYMEILAPYMRDTGKYIAASWDPESEIPFIRNAVKAFEEKLAASPELYDQVEVGVLMPPTKLAPAAPGSVDIIVTFRNIHNWMPRGTEKDMLKAMYDALKPGGILGIVEHRGNSSVPQDPKGSTGYVNEDYAIAMVEAAGFKLVDKSEINANPLDTKDHPEGVWTLPPTLRGDFDHTPYLEIGESDRFTLKFQKPAA